MAFVFMCQSSSLTPFPPADMQTGLSRIAHAADERQFLFAEIMKLTNEAAQLLLLTRGPSCGLHRKCPITKTLQGCCRNACKEV